MFKLADYYTYIYSPVCKNPYEKLNESREQILKFLSEEAELHGQIAIFEQEMPEFKITKQIQKEMQLLKMVWDYVNVIQTSLNEWKKTTWKKLDIEWMDQECKKILRELRRKTKSFFLFLSIKIYRVYNFYNYFFNNNIVLVL